MQGHLPPSCPMLPHAIREASWDPRPRNSLLHHQQGHCAGCAGPCSASTRTSPSTLGSIHPPACANTVISTNGLPKAVPLSTNKHLPRKAEAQPLGSARAVGALLPQGRATQENEPRRFYSRPPGGMCAQQGPGSPGQLLGASPLWPGACQHRGSRGDLPLKPLPCGRPPGTGTSAPFHPAHGEPGPGPAADRGTWRYCPGRAARP